MMQNKLIAGAVGAGVALANTGYAGVLFSDSFNTSPSTSGTPQYSIVSAGADTTMQANASGITGLGNGNQLYLLSANGTSDLSIRAPFSSNANVITVSFDFYEPTNSNYSGSLQVFLYGTTGSTRLNLDDGQVKNPTTAAYLDAYSTNTVVHIDMVINNSSSAVAYNGTTLDALTGTSAYAQIWINGQLSGTLAMAGSINDNVDFTSIGLTIPSGNKQEIYIDNLSVQSGAVVAAVPEAASLGLLSMGSLLMLRRRK